MNLFLFKSDELGFDFRVFIEVGGGLKSFQVDEASQSVIIGGMMLDQNDM